MRIEPLGYHPELATTVALWQRNEWSHQVPGASLDIWIQQVREAMNHDRIPMTMVAINDQSPIGSAVLVDCHMHTRQELSPWLARVYVRPKHRSRGVASALTRKAMLRARLLGNEKLYLYTRHAQKLYFKLGWEALETTRYQGHWVTIMVAHLGD